MWEASAVLPVLTWQDLRPRQDLGGGTAAGHGGGGVVSRWWSVSHPTPSFF